MRFEGFYHKDNLSCYIIGKLIDETDMNNIVIEKVAFHQVIQTSFTFNYDSFDTSLSHESPDEEIMSISNGKILQQTNESLVLINRDRINNSLLEHVHLIKEDD